MEQLDRPQGRRRGAGLEAEAKELDGDIVVHGSATLVQTLTDRGLVDEYRLMVFPIVLGGGKRLFGDTGEAIALRLVESKPVGPDGVVILTYEPATKQGS